MQKLLDDESFSKLKGENSNGFKNAFVFGEIKRFMLNFSKLSQKAIESEKKKAVFQIASQVAHDIRSPLAALDMVISDISEIPMEKKKFVKESTQRIKEIADHLIERRNMNNDFISNQPLRSECIDELVNIIFNEKKTQMGVTSSKMIILKSVVASHYKCKVNSREFKRLCSNLLNNSLEAISNDGQVEIIINLYSKNVLRISIVDNGDGIPPEILSKLGDEGVTYGKENGSGLGLFHAKKTIESWGGELNIYSQVGIGTTVDILLPLSLSSSMNSVTSILIDDDELIRLTWAQSAKKNNIDLKVYSEPSLFIKESTNFDKNVSIYIDSNLGNGIKGEVVAKEIHDLGFKNIYMSTGYESSHFEEMTHIRKVISKTAPWANVSLSC